MAKIKCCDFDLNFIEIDEEQIYTRMGAHAYGVSVRLGMKGIYDRKAVNDCKTGEIIVLKEKKIFKEKE